jgi:hypothetical protein
MSSLIKDPLVVFETNDEYPGAVGAIMYEGDLGEEKPHFLVLDTHQKNLKVTFYSNREEIILEKIPEDTMMLAVSLADKVQENRHMTFARVDESGKCIKPGYDVGLIVI